MIGQLSILVWRRLRLAVAIAAFLPAMQAMSAHAAVGDSPSVNGTWNLADPKADEKDRQSAIERAIENVPRLARAQASKTLLNATKPASKLRVEDRGDSLMLAEQKQQFNLVLGAKPIEVTTEDGKVLLSCERKNQLLVVTAKSSKATRTTVYRPSSDGKTLVLDVALEIAQLQTTTRYNVTYTLLP